MSEPLEVPPPTPPQGEPMHDEAGDLDRQYRVAHERILELQREVQDLKDKNRWLLSAGAKLAYHLNRWGTLHNWRSGGTIVADTKEALDGWEQVSDAGGARP